MGWRSNDIVGRLRTHSRVPATAPQVMRTDFRCVVWSSTPSSRLAAFLTPSPLTTTSSSGHSHNDDRLRLRRDGPARLDQHGGGLSLPMSIAKPMTPHHNMFAGVDFGSCPTGRQDVPKPPPKDSKVYAVPGPGTHEVGRMTREAKHTLGKETFGKQTFGKETQRPETLTFTISPGPVYEIQSKINRVKHEGADLLNVATGLGECVAAVNEPPRQAATRQTARLVRPSGRGRQARHRPCRLPALAAAATVRRLHLCPRRRRQAILRQGARVRASKGSASILHNVPCYAHTQNGIGTQRAAFSR